MPCVALKMTEALRDDAVSSRFPRRRLLFCGTLTRELMRCMVAAIGPNATIQPGAARSNDAAFSLTAPGGRRMAKWIRFEQKGKTGFGTVEGDTIAVHSGDM